MSSQASPDDQQALIEMLIEQASARVEAQPQDTGDADAKALGILAFAVAAIGALIAVAPPLGKGWIPVVFLLSIGGALLIMATLPRDFDSGPEIRTFYERMIDAPRMESSLQMLAQLLRAVEDNTASGRTKGWLYRWGNASLFSGLILAAVIAGLDRLD